MTKPKSEAFDLSSLDVTNKSDAGVEIELTHPVTNKPLGIFVTVRGKESSVFREHIRDKTNANVRRNAMAQRRGKDIEMPTAEQMERDATDLLILCTVGWRSGEGPTITFEGQPLEFTVPNARLIYERLTWVRSQVDEAIGSFELFI